MTDKKRESLPSDYVVPRVWKREEPKDGASGIFSLNSDKAGARQEQPLPRGKHRYQVYSCGTPNGIKVTFLLEYLGVDYDAWFINIGKGDQFGSGFVEANPNSKIPVMLDTKFDPPVRVFESGHILVYIAEQEGKLLPPVSSPRERAEVLNWTFWLQGGVPFIGGGFGHFFNYAPVAIKYAIDRYTMETKRLLDVLDRHLADGREYIVPEAGFSVADACIAPWVIQLRQGYKDTGIPAAEFLDYASYKHINAYCDRISALPAFQRGRRVNGFGDDAVKNRHSIEDFVVSKQ